MHVGIVEIFHIYVGIDNIVCNIRNVGSSAVSMAKKYV